MTCHNAITLDDDALKACTLLRQPNCPRFIIFGFNKDNSKIVLLKASEPDSTHDEFVEALPEADAAYAVYSFDFEHPEGGHTTTRTRTCFITWTPPKTGRIRKFVVANSKHALRSQIPGYCIDFDAASCAEDISEEAFFEKCAPTVK